MSTKMTLFAYRPPP